MKRLLIISLLLLTACSTRPPFPVYPNVSMRKIEAKGEAWYCYTRADAMASADWHDQIGRFQRAYEK
jgi:hypothetical protein